MRYRKIFVALHCFGLIQISYGVVSGKSNPVINIEMLFRRGASCVKETKVVIPKIKVNNSCFIKKIILRKRVS